MSKTFRYTKFTKYHYCDYSDEWEEDGVEFDYEVDNEDLLPEIVELVFNDYFAENKVVCDSEERTNEIKETLSRIIDDNYLIDTLSDQYEDTLKDIFEKEAFDFYND